jgi:HEAT repeat protein
LERLFLLRTILLDASLTKPGWFWVSEWKLNLDTWLPWFASQDSEEDMRVQAIALATRIGFPLYKRKKKFEPPISVLLKDEHASVRLAALQHLAALGREADLPMIERLLRDDDKEVRTQAERTARLVRLRVDPERETKKGIEQRDPFDEGIADAVSRIAEKISNPTLVTALSHPSGALRAIAAKELLRRGSIFPELARVMCGMEAKAVRECGFMAQVGHGQQIESSQVRSALRASYFSYSSDEPWWNKANADAVISAYFDRLSAEELWKRVYSFSEDSHLALRVIGRRFFIESVARLRADLLDDFQNHADAVKTKESESTGLRVPSFFSLSLYGDPNASIESERKHVRTAALEVLADHPDEDDRELFLKYLSTEYGDFGQTIACLRGLSAVGRAEDREKLVPLLSDSAPFVQGAAARAYLALSPSSVGGAKDLLSEPSEYRVWAVIRHALRSEDRALWPLLKPLLGNENENIRRLVCYYATSVLKKAATEKLLNEYLARGRYFYNVVTLLDRALYAPKLLRTSFIREEREFFEKWRPSTTWQWEEQ